MEETEKQGMSPSIMMVLTDIVHGVFGDQYELTKLEIQYFESVATEEDYDFILSKVEELGTSIVEDHKETPAAAEIVKLIKNKIAHIVYPDGTDGLKRYVVLKTEYIAVDSLYEIEAKSEIEAHILVDKKVEDSFKHQIRDLTNDDLIDWKRPVIYQTITQDTNKK